MRRDAARVATRDRRRLQERRDGRRYVVDERRLETRDERCDDESVTKRPAKGRQLRGDRCDKKRCYVRRDKDKEKRET